MVEMMTQMWQYVFEAAVDNELKTIVIADVGGGAFSDCLSGLFTCSRFTLLGLVAAFAASVNFA